MQIERAIKNPKQHKRKAIEDVRVDNLDINIVDITDEANNKTDDNCKNSNNHDQ